MIRRVVVVALGVASLMVGLGADRADACSCVGRKPAEYFAAADMVFLARAGKEVTAGKVAEQPLAVLHTLKGSPGAVFTVRRTADAMSPCGRIFTEHEVAIVFVTRGTVSLCDGNYALAAQAEGLPVLFGLAPAKPVEAVAAPLTRALEVGLEGYLHDRPTIDVAHAALAGKTAKVGKTTLRFAKTAKGGVKVAAALTSGPLHYVSGSYGTEGLSFAVLLHETTPRDGAPELVVLGVWRTER